MVPLATRPRTVVVTGALGGIGRATVARLARDGHRVAGSYAAGIERPEDASAFAEEYPEQVSLLPLDPRADTSTEHFFRAAVDRWGSLDALVNNAAVGSATVAAYASEAPAQDRAMVDINATGTLRLSQLFIAHLQDRWRTDGERAPTPAQLVTISSVGGGVAVFPGFRLSDGMSKAAVAFMTRQLAAEHVHTPLDVFAVCPGATNTGMLQASTLDGLPPDARDRFVRALPKRRLIEPAEIAELIAFLLGPHSRVLHGAVIDASMGLGSRPGLMTELDLHSLRRQGVHAPGTRQRCTFLHRRRNSTPPRVPPAAAARLTDAGRCVAVSATRLDHASHIA